MFSGIFSLKNCTANSDSVKWQHTHFELIIFVLVCIQGGTNFAIQTIRWSGYHNDQSRTRPRMSTLRRCCVRCRTTIGQGHHVAQEMLQLRRMPSTIGFDFGLWWPWSWNPLPLMLRQTLRTKRCAFEQCKRKEKTPSMQLWLLVNVVFFVDLGFGYGHSPTLVSTSGESTIA